VYILPEALKVAHLNQNQIQMELFVDVDVFYGDPFLRSKINNNLLQDFYLILKNDCKAWQNVKYLSPT